MRLFPVRVAGKRLFSEEPHMPRLWLVVAISVTVLTAGSTHAQQGAAGGDWRRYSGDNGSTKYAPLDQIDAKNVQQLQIAWRHPAVDARFTNATFSNSFQSSP